RPGRDIMHPMFVKLFIETDADDLLAEEDRRRRARRSRRARPAMAVRTAARDREHRSRRGGGAPLVLWPPAFHRRADPVVLADGNYPAAHTAELLAAVAGPAASPAPRRARTPAPPSPAGSGSRPRSKVTSRIIGASFAGAPRGHPRPLKPDTAVNHAV